MNSDSSTNSQSRVLNHPSSSIDDSSELTLQQSLLLQKLQNRLELEKQNQLLRKDELQLQEQSVDLYHNQQQQQQQQHFLTPQQENSYLKTIFQLSTSRDLQSQQTQSDSQQQQQSSPPYSYQQRSSASQHFLGLIFQENELLELPYSLLWCEPFGTIVPSTVVVSNNSPQSMCSPISYSLNSQKETQGLQRSPNHLGDQDSSVRKSIHKNSSSAEGSVSTSCSSSSSTSSNNNNNSGCGGGFNSSSVVQISSIQVKTSKNGSQQLQKQRICNCKKTKCLKLYCDCFAIGELCGIDCKCTECCNNESALSERNSAIEQILERNPFAFHVKPPAESNSTTPENIAKLSKKSTSNQIDQQELSANNNNNDTDVKPSPTSSTIIQCNCRKSNCLKKYCLCFQSGVKCTEICKCTECKNIEGQNSDYYPPRSSQQLTNHSQQQHSYYNSQLQSHRTNIDSKEAIKKKKRCNESSKLVDAAAAASIGESTQQEILLPGDLMNFLPPFFGITNQQPLCDPTNADSETLNMDNLLTLLQHLHSIQS